MTHTRRDVWKLPAGDKTLEWYGKAVESLQQRPFTDATSWWSLAAMHGLDERVWTAFGFIDAGTAMPPAATQKALWRQCQHLTWYFLPWHRGYLGAFEAIIRDAVKSLGGPDDWALPYWNYSADPVALRLPPAFESPALVDGSKNYLHVSRRYGAALLPKVQSPIVLDSRIVDVTVPLRERFFEGIPSDAPSGFGGVKTPFWHGEGGTFGVLESQPHGGVHVFVGGGFKAGGLSRDPLDLGLMTNPDTAALDPIFWLHHANIDRLWNVWLRQTRRPNDPPEVFANPSDPDWLDGPRDQAFLMPYPDGRTFEFTSREMLDTLSPALDYVYDDENAPAAPSDSLALRFEMLGASPALAAQLSGTVTVAQRNPAELIGANEGTLRLADDLVESRVRLDEGRAGRLSQSLDLTTLDASAPREPDHVYLTLENIRSPTDAAAFYVYVNLPQGADPKAHPELFAGTVSMFGVSAASQASGPTGGSGVSASFDITPIVDRLHASGSLGQDLTVQLVSAVPGATDDQISIGRIGIYQQAQ